jgi:hypothetical protein
LIIACGSFGFNEVIHIAVDNLSTFVNKKADKQADIGLIVALL